MRASTWAVAPLLLVVACADAESEPPGPPTAFEATPGAGTIALSWTPAPTGTGTAIVRFDDAGGIPADVELEVGRTFGGGVVLYVGDGDSFVDASIDACARYAYSAVTLYGRAERSGPAVASVEAATAIAHASSPPDDLTAELETRGVRLRWEAPATAADHVRIVRRDDEPPEGPDDGTVIANPRGVTELVDPIAAAGGMPGLEPGATYFYGAYACDACGACESVGAHASASTPVDLGDAPTDLVVDPNGATVDFTWKGGGSAMRLVMRVGSPVEGPEDADAEVLYEGPGPEAQVAMATFLPDVFAEETHYHFAVYACAGDTCGEGAAADRAFTLREALRGGGYILYFAHATAGVCVDRTDLGMAEETEVPDWWKSCVRSCDQATAEQLSAEGYDEAQAAGLALRNAGIPFDRVLSSEYCRAVETAERLEIALPSAIETRPELTLFVHGDDAFRCDGTSLLLGGSALGAPDRNAAIVGHVAPCAGLDALAPGEALVVKPGGSGPLHVAQVAPDEWGELP